MKIQTIFSVGAHLFAGTLLAMNKLPAPAIFVDLPEGKAFIIEAKTLPEGKPWVWYAPTLATYPNQGHAWYVERFMAKGISVAGINLGEVRGSPASSEKFTAFYNEMVKRGYSKKPLLLGQSRGGLMMLTWAMRNPDKLSGLVGIYPVCNLTSWPLKNSKEAVLKDYGLTEERLLADIQKYNPQYNLAGLAEKKVPLFMVHGTKDTLVPYEDNSKLIKESYEALGGPIIVKMIEGKGHQESAEFFKCTELVEFVLKTVSQQEKKQGEQ
jgi:predicted esterase